jgi:hypothetical protein
MCDFILCFYSAEDRTHGLCKAGTLALSHSPRPSTRLLRIQILFTIFWEFFFPVFCLFEIGSPYVAQAGLELVIFLPPPPECWDYS